jgi:putative component of membrane protein insertase Oxa1/YidC/SpoIIIJ protein YidD
VTFVGWNTCQIMLKYLLCFKYARKERNKWRLIDVPGLSSGLWHEVMLIWRCAPVRQHGVTIQKNNINSHHYEELETYTSFSFIRFRILIQFHLQVQLHKHNWGSTWIEEYIELYISHWSYRAHSRYCTSNIQFESYIYIIYHTYSVCCSLIDIMHAWF